MSDQPTDATDPSTTTRKRARKAPTEPAPPPTPPSLDEGAWLDEAATWRAVHELQLWAANPKRNDHKLDQAVASLRAFGFGSPVVECAETRDVIAGNARLKGVRAILKADPNLTAPENARLRASLRVVDTPAGGAWALPVRRMRFDDEAHRHAYALTDNVQIGDPDVDAQYAMVREIHAHDAELAMAIGYSTEELLNMLDSDPDEVEAEVTRSSTSDAIQNAIGNANPLTKSIRLVQFAYSPEEHAEFVSLVKAIAGTEKVGPATVVLRALRAAAPRAGGGE